MRVVLSILLLLVLLPSYSGDERLMLWPKVFAMKAERMELDWSNPGRKRLGKLTYLGGVRLSSAVHGFGGFSALSVTGNRFTLLNDSGNFVQFRLSPQWRVSDVSGGAITQGPGSGWRKIDRDSESLTRDPITGAFWVGFEYYNQIWRYDASFQDGQGIAPLAMAKWPRNGGAEALVRLRNGSFLVFPEIARAKSQRIRYALSFVGDPVRAQDRGFRFCYLPPKGFRVSDAAELPDGRIVLLNRRASLAEGFTTVVTVIERTAIRSGGVINGRELARFAAPVVHDNFEALAVTQEGAATILWIASDDNQSPAQRSLLLKFRLNDAPGS